MSMALSMHSRTLTTFVRMCTTTTRVFLGNRRFKCVINLWINLAPVVYAAQCGRITCVWRTLLALVTDMYGDTYSMVGDVVVRIVFKLVKSSFNKKKKKIKVHLFIKSKHQLVATIVARS